MNVKPINYSDKNSYVLAENIAKQTTGISIKALYNSLSLFSDTNPVKQALTYFCMETERKIRPGQTLFLVHDGNVGEKKVVSITDSLNGTAITVEGDGQKITFPEGYIGEKAFHTRREAEESKNRLLEAVQPDKIAVFCSKEELRELLDKGLLEWNLTILNRNMKT